MENEEKLLEFIRELVRSAEGDNVVDKLDKLADIAIVIEEHLRNADPIPKEEFDGYNAIVKELYPKKFEGA